MTIPTSSLFPTAYDNDENLFLVHDALRVRLVEDYRPGDKSILVEGDAEVIARFPPSGIITLTEQCSDIDVRALSFHYASKTSGSFDGLEILPAFVGLDSVKPKRITNVTMNVMAMHHNHLKDSLKAAQSFLGTKRSSDEESITARIRYLESIAFRPKAWFSASELLGLSPLTVTFKNESFRLGYGWVTQEWDFGDGTTLSITTQDQADYSSYEDNISGVQVNGTSFTKTYAVPDVYGVKLTIRNEYGEDTVEFSEMITVKNECPLEARIDIKYRASQSYTPGGSSSSSWHPKIRSVANAFIDLEVEDGEDPSRPGYSYSGEMLKLDGKPVDPIIEYTWSLGDDLPHSTLQNTRASYSLGGVYDIVLRVDTTFGSYKITKYENSIDIVEAKNLWLFNFPPSGSNSDGSGVVKAYEFGLNSETFKLLGNQTLHVDRNNGFLGSYASGNYYAGTMARAKAEFARNVEFVQCGTTSSGNKGNSLLFWAGGGAAGDSGNILVRKYNAFDDHYEALPSIEGRPWNWVSLNSADKSYFLFGSEISATPYSNPVTTLRTDYDLSSLSASSPIVLGSSYFENGADELLEHASEFDGTGMATSGYFATYRSAWKDSVGYILRNSAVNEFFRLSGFYRTNGSLGSPFNTITKLPDMAGSAKVEAQMISMSNGVFVFNNSGEVCAWNDTSLTWEVGRTGSSSLTFRGVQDTSSSGFDDRSNTLLAASDGDRMAYLSYDYSDKAFVKFNGIDLTFSTTKYRPPGKQFKMGVY